MNARPTAKQIAQTAVLNGHLIPAGGPMTVKLPCEVWKGEPKSPRRYVKRKPKLPLTPVTKNGKHLFIIYPR